MHFHKFPYPANFQFINRASPGKTFKTNLGHYRLDISANSHDVYKIKISGKNWERNDSQAGLNFKPIKGMQSANSRLSLDKKTGLRLTDNNSAVMLESLPIGFFGQNGEASIFQFKREEDTQFYGMGEKWTGFEHSKKITKFWNTDVCADFTRASFTEGKPASDPVYLSIPYLIIKRGNTYTGLLLDNPHATFIATGLSTSIANQMNLPAKENIILLGSERGQPNLYLIHGPSLRELTPKMQQLTGTTPLPPAWSLGYHQCRWGYKSAADLNTLDTNFRKHKIPVDGLWLDIDYMDNYKVFTLDKQHFPRPKKNLAKLTRAKRRIVPILDPGVKLQPGYPVYERGTKANAFCLNPQGTPYIGLVWPGESVFPDFSLKTARDWWAGEVTKLARQGITSAWLDMNDPSTGLADNQDMLFDHGRQPHDYYHNQYALGMAIATQQGLLATKPNERPFLLSRSGFTGSNKYTAIWTGDNSSNYYHLKNGIATTLNLALSGIPFNGGDIGGFSGDTTAPLIRDWHKAAFLHPFFRNHCLKIARQQEPWAFDTKTLSILRHYIQLRYRLRPYLYQLFAEHESTGEAIIRPLFYDFADTKEQPLAHIADQFMIGPNIMQAPFINEAQTKRNVLLPGKTHWFSIPDGKWLPGGKTITTPATPAGTPWYIRDGAILPAARTAPHQHQHQLQKIDFHLFLNHTRQTTTNYTYDDGLTFNYRRGKRSKITLTATRTGPKLTLQWQHTQQGYGPGDFTFTTPKNITEVQINGRTAKPTPPPKESH